MRAWSVVAASLGSLAFIAAPAHSQDRSIRTALGYAFAGYLESGGGSAPLGAFVSIASTGRAGFEGDVAYHRDSEFGLTLNTFIIGVGPRFGPGSGDTRPFFHLLAGLRHDRIRGSSNTAVGGSAGGGADIPLGTNLFVHLGADFQIFFDEGTNLKTFRLAAGIAF
jgi:hypothetical protein